MGRDNAEYQRMATYSLDIGQYYSFDTSVLLHRHFDVGAKAKGQRGDTNPYANCLPHGFAFGHIHPRIKGPDGDAAPNSNSVVSPYTHTYIHPGVRAYSYARANAY
jgi:hypothetical protein